ncbi:LutC/YkgG family protein [Ramlibacter sp.]|uniref:LutC/YkgG family protein n=1 Tax=Ramlibacter sp. TaxID=1917967 RepID=UPI002C6DC6E8|nr:LUD domain-containing protein [Ramlibacter sp.]HWI82198.1 LUD domain-containing protein [Ramlibacter sp.]
MSSREFILANVRRRQPPAAALPAVPRFERPPVDLPVAFGDALAAMGGRLAVPAGGQSLDEVVASLFPGAANVCSATPQVRGSRDVASVQDPRELSDVDVGVVRAAFGVAETGSVALSEREFGVNALGFLSQHLVVLLDPAAILADLATAYRQPWWREVRYGTLLTGPSATADIEGVLVRGAQGIRSLTVVLAGAAGG